MNKLKELGFAGFFSEVLDPDNYYTKSEIIELLSQIETPSYLEVNTLPAVGEPNVIYLIPKQGGGKEQWIYSNGQWIDIGGTDIDLSQYVKKTDLVDMVYPIGSTIVMPTNTNPSTLYTGTEWQLYDKAFKNAYYNDIATWNTTNVTAMNADIRLADHSAIIRVQFTNNIAISDTNMTICTLDMARFIDLSGWNNVSTPIFSDALNALGNARIYITNDTIKVDAEPPSDIIMTSGPSGEIVFDRDRPGYSESPAVFTPPEYSEEPYTIPATIIFEDFVMNGSEPRQQRARIDVEVDGDYVYINFGYSGCVSVVAETTDNRIRVINNCFHNEQTCSWSSVVVKKEV